jgi:cardiolipin synthase
VSGDATALLDHLSAMGQALSPDTINDLSTRIQELPRPESATLISAPSPRERVLVERLIALWNKLPDLSAHCVAFALLAAGRTASQVADLQTIELAWTGPRTGVIPTRRIDQALYEVVASSERELVVVSYAVFNVPRVVEALNAAVDRGVDVILVLEFEGAEGEQTYDPLVALRGLRDSIAVYHWPFSKRPDIGHGKRGFIHVKAAVADQTLALISSANMTSYGLEANMELGVLVRGAVVPERIGRHFRQLIQEGVLELWRK